MKEILIPRVFIDEKNELEEVFKKIYITEKDGEKVLRFPSEIYDENGEHVLFGEIYDVPAKNIQTLFQKALLDFVNGKDNISLSDNEITISISKDATAFYLIVRMDDLGEEEGEEIVAIDFYPDQQMFDPDSFGIDLLHDIAKEELEQFVTIILKNNQTGE